MTATLVTIPTLETPRLRLRAPEMRDFDAFAAFRGSARAVHVGGPTDRIRAFSDFSALIGHWHLRGFGRWLVADRATDAALGVVGPMFPEGWPEPEIAWSLFDGAEGRGLALEAAQAARAFAYDRLGWTTVVSLVAPDNPRSAALARRMGARIDGVHPHPLFGPLDIWRHPAPADLREAG
jgi:ribosomal-protein-alanine N-acetyltransferase